MQHNNISNCKFNLQHGLLLALQLSHCVIAWICFCNFEKDLSREEKKAKGVRNWPIGAWPTPETFLLNEGLVGANPSWRHYIQQIPTGNVVHCDYWDVLLQKQLDNCRCLNARTPAAKQRWARLPLGRTSTHGTWVPWAGKETSVPSICSLRGSARERHQGFSMFEPCMTECLSLKEWVHASHAWEHKHGTYKHQACW